MLNTKKKEFTISASAAGKPEAADAGIAVNDKGSVELTKEDADGTRSLKEPSLRLSTRKVIRFKKD
nr:hypothetical protein P5621_19540 [Bacillus subtilis]